MGSKKVQFDEDFYITIDENGFATVRDTTDHAVVQTFDTLTEALDFLNSL